MEFIVVREGVLKVPAIADKGIKGRRGKRRKKKRLAVRKNKDQRVIYVSLEGVRRCKMGGV